MCLLLLPRCIDRGAGIECPFFGRGISLGFDHIRAKIWKNRGLLHRVAELLRLDLRPGEYRVYSFQRRGADVRFLPPRVRGRAMAHLRCIPLHYMAMHALRHLLQ